MQKLKKNIEVMELCVIDDTRMEMNRIDHCNTAILMAQKMCISVYQKIKIS